VNIGIVFAVVFILAAATLGVLLASQAFAWGPGFGKSRGWNYNRGTVFQYDISANPAKN
jgi:hypothetical protein